MEECTIEKDESILKCGTQYELEKIADLLGEKIIRISDSLSLINLDIKAVESKTDKIVAILAQNELIISSIHQLTENYAELQRTNRNDHSAIHSKMQSLTNAAIMKSERYDSEIKMTIDSKTKELESKIKNVENKYDQRLTDFVTHKGVTFIIAIVGTMFALITFMINYMDKIIP